MKIQSRILLSVVSSIVLSLIIGVVAFSILRGANRETRRIATFNGILDKAHALSILTATLKEESTRGDLLQIKQTLLSLEGLSTAITSLIPREDALIRQLRENHRGLGPLIDQMFAYGQAATGIETERRSILASQIWMKVQFILDDANRLMDISRTRIVAAQERAGAMVILLILILALETGAVYFLTGRTIVRSQEKLRESQERLALAASGTRIGIYDRELTTDKVFWTEHFARIMGLDYATTTTTTTTTTSLSLFCQYSDMLASIHREDLPRVEAEQRRCMSERLPCEVEYRVVWPDGSVHWVADRGVFQHGLNGHCTRMLGILMDITERKKAEELLKADLHALTRMHGLSVRKLETGGLQSLLQEVMDTAVVIMGAQRGTLQLLEDNSLRIVAHHGHREPFLEFFASAENRASACGEAMTSGERVIIPDVETSPLFAGTPSLAVLREAGVRALQSTPMKTRGGVLLGILTMQWEVPHPPGEHDLRRIDLLARQATDLIQHTLAEKALIESEERYRELVESSNSIVMRADKDLSIMYMNEFGLKFFGYTAQELIGKNVIGKTIPERDDKGRDLSAMAREIVGSPDRFRTNVHQNMRKGGELVWVSWTNRVKFNPDGSAKEIFAIGNDITELKKAEEALRESEELLEKDLHAITRLQKLGSLFASEGNLETVLGEIVDTAIEISGADFGNIQLLDTETLTLRIAAHRGFPEWWVDFWNRVYVGRGSCGMALGSGERVVVENVEQSPIFIGTPDLDIQLKADVRAVQSTPLVTRAGNPLGMFSTHYRAPHRPDERTLRLLDLLARHAADIIERMQNEGALRRSRDELEIRVRERTAKLEHKTRELQEFSYVASHDLREPLRKIQTFGDLLKAKSGDRLHREERDYVSRMAGAASRMQELLDALLAYSRVETQARDPVPLKLDEIVRMVTADLEVTIEKTGTELEIGPLPVIKGDPYQWRQVFQNLIANAIKYHRLEVKPRIKFYSEQNGDGYQILVDDNGIGFDEIYLDKIFRPFQRLHGRNQYPGTGIGLAVCKKILERHGGTITARSTLGKGSTFILTLPVSRAK